MNPHRWRFYGVFAFINGVSSGMCQQPRVNEILRRKQERLDFCGICHERMANHRIGFTNETVAAHPNHVLNFEIDVCI